MVIAAEDFEIIFCIGKRIFSLVNFCLLFVIVILVTLVDVAE